jgi:predicted enzyme involved in methoxymalonyl-ACP biosynthesis
MNDCADRAHRLMLGGTVSYNRLDLGWLPVVDLWAERISAVDQLRNPEETWSALVALANSRTDFARTLGLDRSLRRHFADAPPPDMTTAPVRLAVLSSATVSHLLPAIRVAGLRRGIWITTFTTDFGQYLQELSNESSALYAFAPNALVFALDARHLLGGIDPSNDEDQVETEFRRVTAHVNRCWHLARDAFHCPMLQQTVLPVFPALLGNNEHRLRSSRRRGVARLNALLRELADSEGIDVLAIDEAAAEDGLVHWHNPLLWHHGKLEVSPEAAPFYGELVVRLIAAHQGRSRKCLVLDLDNTLWGGVVAEDDINNIILGQGNALGEAFIELQHYVRDLARRGIILAVCSKNDPEQALAPFEHHPEMVLRR